MAERTPRSKTMPGRGRTTRAPSKSSASATPASTPADQPADLAALTAKLDQALGLLNKLVAAQAQTAATSTAAMTVKQFAAESRLGTTTIYQLITDGKIASIKVGKRRLIPREELQKLLTVHQT